MIIIVAWPFLIIWAVLWLLIKAWRVTVPLAVIGLITVIYHQSPAWGLGIGITLTLIVIWVLKTRADDHAAAIRHSEGNT